MNKTKESVIDIVRLVPSDENGNPIHDVTQALTFFANSARAAHLIMPLMRKIAQPTTFELVGSLIIVEQVPVGADDDTSFLIVRRICTDASLHLATIKRHIDKHGRFNTKKLPAQVSGPWSRGYTWTMRLSTWWAEQQAGWAWARYEAYRAKLGHPQY